MLERWRTEGRIVLERADALLRELRGDRRIAKARGLRPHPPYGGTRAASRAVLLTAIDSQGARHVAEAFTKDTGRGDPATRHGALESAGGRRIPQPSKAVADEHSCTSAASPVATGPALTHAGWWSHIFAAALDLSLERRFEPATRPHTAVSADVNVELNACEFTAVGTCTRFATHHARSRCSSGATSG